ncbi:nuclear transport factor 2 family protein [Psychromonas sp. Urea-02u-13]|uniref:nuclear transport factor 2 family protein n=1 Tax=Psychromonas sp. Urea-02u-13 TaxID=2058326 RepID=UPI000C335649|nr:nuclear transport factor 2 family protein [Psychromonas sp. Urea-02u-13]PKG38476.1 transcriptional regulator [Psychromonas sp. Urea-02u-13]
MNSPLLTDFCRIYQGLESGNLQQLKDVYSPKIEFVDAVDSLQGIDALIEYFQHLYENMKYCRFIIENIIEENGQACLIWRMEYAHHKINSGKMITVDGSSFLRFSDKIDYHRDYVDMGQMLYEHLPVVGRVIKGIKNRVKS